MLDVEFTQITDPGRVREHNEDYLGYVLPHVAAQLRSHGCLFALADGVGGQQKGEVASRLAVESVLDGFVRAREGEPHKALLTRLVQAANTQVYEMGGSSGSRTGMATTLVACALRFDHAVVAHVGDSRCYLIRSGKPKLITNDHTVVNEQARLGILSAREAAESTNKHLLSRSVGDDMFVAVEINDVQVEKGDVLVLCSDGLHGPVPEPDIASIVTENQYLSTAAERLIALANQRDGSDNVSVQLIRVHDVERTGMYRGRPYKIR
ncbi:MAG TPA: protein phosphatase 2C domain-containing protein [Terriglobales bacterium]|jgi:protein phosphatase